MTAEASLTDERLAELIAYCESFNPVTHSQIVEQLSALRELQAYRAKRETPYIELRPDERYDGSILDELVAKNCTVHLERMDEHWYCLIVENDERRVMLNIGTSSNYRRKVNARVYEDSPQALAASDGNPP